MYTIKVDGAAIYTSDTEDVMRVLRPQLSLEMDAAGSLSFVLPPGHAAYDTVRKLKSIVTVEQDGTEIFRGRAMEEKTDIWKQKEVYCEGDLSFLLDSVQRPFTFSGKVSAFCTQLLATHNTQVEAEKRFSLGDLSALEDMDVNLSSDGYADTLGVLRSVLEEQDGYLRTRTAGGVHYVDFVKQYGENDGQTIKFGVNLLDLDSQDIAEDLCTVILPIGGMLEDGTTVTIASVNGGSDTIESAEGIAQYGRIVKTYVFDLVTDPSELLKLARKKLDEMAIGQTLTLNAVDMHIIEPGKGIILPGVPALLHIEPHNINAQKVCTAADIDMENPEKNVYTFGQPVRTQSSSAAMITNRINTHEKTLMQQLKHYTETDYTVKIHAGLLDSHDEYIAQAGIEIDGIKATILQHASRIDKAEGSISEAWVAIDGANAAIELKASKSVVDDLSSRLSQAEVDIDGANAAITLKANQTTVDELGERVSSAEIAIDGANAEIALKVSKDGLISAINMSPESIKISSSKIELDGQTIVSKLEGLYLDVSSIDAVEADFNSVWAVNGTFDNLTVGSYGISLASKYVCTGGKGVSAVGTTVINYLDHDGNKKSEKVVIGVDQYQLPTTNLYYLSYDGG